MKITFINPNSAELVDKYLPKILAEAVFNQAKKEIDRADVGKGNGYDVKHSA